MKKIILKRKHTPFKVALKIVLKRKLQNDLQLLTDEDLELASIAATYYASTIPTFENGYEWKGALEDAEWLAERGKLMIDGPFAWFNEEDFTREELDEYFAIKEAGLSVA